MKNIDLSIFDVTVTQNLWLNSQIVAKGVYRAPVQKKLLDYAVSQKEETNPLAYLSKNGNRVNPFVVIDDIDDFEGTGSGDDGSNGGGNDDGGNKSPMTLNEIASMFKSAEEFGDLSDKKQSEYINTIKETPENLSEEESDLYDEVLYQNLNEYKEVAKTKTAKVVAEVLAMYEDDEDE